MRTSRSSPAVAELRRYWRCGARAWIDTSAKTFTVDSSGKTDDFKLVGDSKADITEIKKHMDTKEQIEVKYTGSSSPCDVVAAD